MRTKKILIGEVCVDSGCIVIADPCHAEDVSNEEAMETYLKSPHGEACIVNKHEIPLGVIAQSGMGDGIYPVYANVCPNGRTLSLTIEFLPAGWTKEQFGKD